MMQVIEGSFTPLPDAVGEVIANDFVHGWHVHVNVAWDQIGAGTKLYTAAQMTAFAKEVARKSQVTPTQGADARPVAMTNGSFHCPACGETMKGPLACGHCLWQKPEAVDAEIGADGIATSDAAPRTDDARPVAIYQEQDCSGHWIDIPRIRYNMIPNPLWKRIVYTTRMDGDRHE